MKPKFQNKGASHPMNRQIALIAIMTLPRVCLALAEPGSTGAITGTITVPAGSLVPLAEIKVTNSSSGDLRTTASTNNGAYLVALLPPGSYRVEVSKPGFKLSSYPNITVNVTETQTLNVRLEVGAVSEQVTVASDAELLQTTSAALGRVTDERMVVELPLPTQNSTYIVWRNPRD